ncbi:MAG: sensor histidine kinase [Eubacteriales bacterium]|nr:sensor histidine kinase [Eubacteriales bacterium]
MLLILMTLFVLASLVLMCVQPRRRSALIFLTCFTLADFLFWVLTYIAKKGGISQAISTVFYLNRSWRGALQYMAITLPRMSFMAALGRFLFPVCLMALTLDLCESLSVRLRRRLAAGLTAAPLLCLVLYIPAVFEQLVSRGRTWQMALVIGSRVLVIGYGVAALALLAVELIRMPSLYFRARFVRRYAFIPLLVVIYLLFCAQDPGQIYLFYRDEYMMDLGLWYLQPAVMSAPLHITLLTCTLACGCVSFFFLGHMTVHDLTERRKRKQLHLKNEMARVGGNIFVHSIKNQILATQVYDRKLAALLAQGSPDLAAVRRETQALALVHTQMREHMDALYRILSERSLALAPVRVGDWLDGVEHSFRQKFPAAQLIVYRSPEADDSTVLLNEESMREALLDLMQNALEAGGEDKPVELACAVQQGAVMTQVRDYGPGIPREKMRHIFEPFFTEKNTNRNWGMGLFYVRRIVRSHGGHIHVDSTVGRGASFFVLLPRVRDKRRR